jgi:hypothetical protein
VLGMAILSSAPAAWPYSVLTHEAIVDSTWDSAIKPLLVKRFPASTADELTEAHGYAYAGSIIQDLGYYPFGSKFFSDLTHYVRSGDFIVQSSASFAKPCNAINRASRGAFPLHFRPETVSNLQHFEISKQLTSNNFPHGVTLAI